MRKIFNWILVIMYMGAIFYFSSKSSLPSAISGINDKFLHTMEYTVLGILFIWALTKSVPTSPVLWLYLFTILFCLLYGISDELHQSFVPGRDASMYDVLADCTGGILGVFIWKLLHYRKSYSLSKI